MSNRINQVSNETESAMLRKSAFGLPNRPSESGMKAEDIKKAFYKSLIDSENSILSELKRVINEANEADLEIEKSAEELSNKLGNFSNPNLLINSDFRVNQRGKSAYVTGDEYTVDRWRRSGGATVIPSSSGVTITAGDTDAYFSQYIERGETSIVGKTVTISMCLADGTIVSTTGTIGSTLDKTHLDVNYNYGRLYLRRTASGVCNFIISVNAGNSITIKWAKLEIGSIATAYSPRPYAEELGMCQRYYVKLKPTMNYGTIAVGSVTDRTRTENSDGYKYSITFSIFLPVDMRMNPTIAIDGKLSTVVRGKWNNGLTIDNISASSGRCQNNKTIHIFWTVLDADASEDGKVSNYLGFSGTLRSDSSLATASGIEFDAEMYEG